jgi:carboxymethylenebutenolidase
MPPEAITRLEDALRAWGGRYQSEVYEGALHGWMIAGGRVYHAEHAERGFAKLMELLDETLLSPVAA